MLPPVQKLLFLLFAAVAGGWGLHGFYRLYRRIAAGREDSDERFDRLPSRIWYALVTTLTQSRTFRKRTVVSIFHSFIFYGFTFYLLVNLVDAIDGFFPLSFASLGLAGQVYVLLADVLSALVLVGVVALVIRRFLLPSRVDFRFNERTLLHPNVTRKYITFDSIFVSSFILFHVGSRAIGAGAKLAAEGPDRFAPFASLLSHLFTPQNALAWRIFGYWGALGSVLAFLGYFPYSKHIHIFMAPAKYLVARPVASGVMPAMELNMEAETPKLGAKHLEDLAWPRLLDAYACIQCNRCQEVCPATATGKSLSPSALEINKRMELNQIARDQPDFEGGAPSPNPLLSFALSPEAAWACTTCGACIDICPVGDEPMLDILDIRRQQVMIEGEFPAQLQTAFRGMERAKNPWGINHDKRLDWAQGLNVKTTDQNPEPDVLFWVGCAASYDPQSQKTARAFVQLLDHAGVDFAVLGKRECCTGDTARRAGNEYLYRQLADANVATLNEVKPKLIVATCPHCMNTVGKEYKQLGGDYKVMHHTEYLETLVVSGKLVADEIDSTVTYHDPCYLGRHNGVYDAPRNLLHIVSNTVVEMPRNKENSFCCGAGGAQFWKEEEEGTERISENRYREAQQTLPEAQNKVLAVGCPFCKSMLDSTPGKGDTTIVVRDVAELLWEGVEKRSRLLQTPPSPEESKPEPRERKLAPTPTPQGVPQPVESFTQTAAAAPEQETIEVVASPSVTRKKWTPKSEPQSGKKDGEDAVRVMPSLTVEPVAVEAAVAPPETRKKWAPKNASAQPPVVTSEGVSAALPIKQGPAPDESQAPANLPQALDLEEARARQLSLQSADGTQNRAAPSEQPIASVPTRKTWVPKKPSGPGQLH